MSADQIAGPGGVIHDIGYRRYTEPRLGPEAVARALFPDSLRGSFGLGRSGRSKVMPFALLVLCCLPAAVLVVVAHLSGNDELPFRYYTYLSFIFPAITLFVGGQAPAAVSRDLRYRVLSLYFSRPLSRRGYVTAKYGALTWGLCLLMAARLLILYGGALLTEMPFLAQTRGLLQGLIAAVLLSAALAGIGLLIASVTPRRGIGMAAVIAVLVMLTGVQEIIMQLALEQNRPGLGQYSRLLSPPAMVDGVMTWLFGLDPRTAAMDQQVRVARPTAAQGLAYLAGLVVVVLSCYGLLLGRYRRVSIA